MGKLSWECHNYLVFKGRRIPLGEEVPPIPIKQFSPFIKKMLPYIKLLDLLRSYFFVSGFVERTLGKWIRENLAPEQNITYLDIGCGDLALRGELPKHVIYNAFDIHSRNIHWT